jgi:uncharacterized protein (TIGR02271 family)
METERTPAEGKTGPMSGGESFRDEDIRGPVMEEEVEIHKRPVVKEEVRARKRTHTEERDVSGEVRKEDIEIDRDRPEKKK